MRKESTMVSLGKVFADRSSPRDARTSAASVALSTRPYWPQLDGIRALAFLLVFFHHCPRIDLTDSTKWFAPAFNQIFNWGWTGVDLFFVLSGFLITSILLREKLSIGSVSFKNFFIKRALRIWPVYYMLLLVCGVIVPLCQGIMLTDAYREFLLKHLLPMTFFLGNYSLIFGIANLVKVGSAFAVPIVAILSPMWSLAVEEQFYLTWPFVVKRIKGPLQLICVILSLMIVSFSLRALLQKESVGTGLFAHLTFPNLAYTYTTFSHMDGLMVGASLAVLFTWYDRFIPSLQRCAPLLLASSLVLLGWIVAKAPTLDVNTPAHVPLYTVLSIAFGYLVLSSLLSDRIARIFSQGWLRDIGKVSYAMYVFHGGVVAMAGSYARTYLPQPSLLSWFITTSVALLATYGLAKLSWWLIESKCLALRHRFEREPATSIASTAKR